MKKKLIDIGIGILCLLVVILLLLIILYELGKDINIDSEKLKSVEHSNHLYIENYQNEILLISILVIVMVLIGILLIISKINNCSCRKIK